MEYIYKEHKPANERLELGLITPPLKSGSSVGFAESDIVTLRPEELDKQSGLK